MMGRLLVTRALLCLAIVLLGKPSNAAPRTFRIGQFSSDWSARVTVDDAKLDDVFLPGSVSVLESRTGKTLISVSSDELYLGVSGDAAKATDELPYDKQSLVVHLDFDFDGRPDLAILDGQKSCYHGPSYRIYLQRRAGFVESAPFTRLAQENCGLFAVDAAKRRLQTTSKNGCCMHEFSTYAVWKGVPYLLESVVQTVLLDAPAYVQLDRTGRAPSFMLVSPADMPSPPIVEFALAGTTDRRVVVFASEGTLDYALVTGPERRVELSYLLDVAGRRRGSVPEQLPRFSFDPAKRELTFRNGAYRYVVCDAPDHLGVEVHHAGRRVFLAGDPQTRAGGLERLTAPLPSNVELGVTR
jgi:hypothetical protein